MAPNHILLVDDDVQLARSIAELLRRHGYEVALAHQGKAAMKYLATSRVALVISDIFMPDCDGIELLALVGSLNPAPPLLAMSGSSTTRVTGMLKIAAALGAARTLPKPFEPSVLLALVRELIGPATVSAPSPAG
jgi:DNA-binding response OmpR family regulator